MRTELILVRHAETFYNVERRIAGLTCDSDLTKTGIIQSRKLSKMISREDFDAVYSSPLGRSLETVKLAVPNRNEIRLEDGLVERDFGEIDGMKWSEVQEKRPGFRDRYLRTGELSGSVGAESFNDGQERIYATMKRIVEKNPDKKILVFSHGTIIRLFLAKIMGLSKHEAMKIIIENCAINRVSFENDKFKVESINGKHLN